MRFIFSKRFSKHLCRCVAAFSCRNKWTKSLHPPSCCDWHDNTWKVHSAWNSCSPVTHIYPFSCNPSRTKEPKCEWTCFSTEAKWCLLTFRNAWDAGASLEAELVAARAREESDKKASERVSPDYRMMRDGWKVRQRKQLGPPLRPPPPPPCSHWNTGPRIMRGRQSLSCSGWRFLSGQARPRHVDSSRSPPPFNHIGIYILALLHGCCGIRSQIAVKFSLLVSPDSLDGTYGPNSPPKSSHKLKRKNCCYSALLFFIFRVVVMVQVRL